MYLITHIGRLDGDDTATVAPLTANGAGDPICHIRLQPENIINFGPDSLEELYRLLSAIMGDDPPGNYSYRPIGNIRTRKLPRTYIPLLVRPWADTPEPYNTRETVDRRLASWRLESLAQKIYDRQLQALLIEAERDLAAYYRGSFGYAPNEARFASHRKLDWLLRYHFRFQRADDHSWHRDWAIRAQTRGLQVLIASEADIEEIGAKLTEISEEFEDNSERTGMLLAFSLDRPDVIRLLLNAGANVNYQNAFGKTPLMYAAELDLIEAARLLVTEGANLDLRACRSDCTYRAEVEKNELTGLQYAIHNNSREMIDLLVSNDADTNADADAFIGPYGGSSLINAIKQWRYDIARDLLDAGASIDNLDSSFYTALHHAAANNSIEMVAQLIARGANTEFGHQGSAGTPLVIAARRGYSAIARALLEAGAQVDSHDVAHGTALMIAAEQGHQQIVEILITAGADIHYCPDWGRYNGQNAWSLASTSRIKQLLSTPRISNC